MRAIVIHGPKDLRIENGKVSDPGPGEVLIDIDTGGVCGSDLHYYNHGGFGPVRLKQPMVLGHEVSGRISRLGDGVEGLAVGDLVAVSPSRPCRHCRFCNEGLHNQCLNMRFYGSAMPFPHIQGAFQQQLAADALQCVKADGLSAGEAAMAEPLSVALHATRRAGEMLGKRVLVTGCGPIGQLCILAARRAGAAQIVVTDLAPNALDLARKSGADHTINVRKVAEPMKPYCGDKGTFDVMFECSGVESALHGGITAMRPRGVIMQLGLSGDMSIPMMQLTAKELDLRGSFRFHEEFAIAVKLMQSGLIDVKHLITHTVSLDEAEQAFIAANDRTVAMKAQIRFN